FGDDSPHVEAVRAAWKEVGVGNRSGAPSDGSSGTPAGTIVVRRTGGFAGTAREEQLDLSTSPLAGEVADLLSNAPEATAPGQPQPDRFTYTISVSGRQITVAEQDLTPELSRIVEMVLGD
ncbi:MAG: protealysin inhibitor emfourin, partial [Nocardioidaceae bacterium]